MQQPSVPARLLLVASILALWAVGAAGRLVDLQLVHYDYYLARARRQQQRFVEISPKRADIFDRNMRELAMSTAVESCFAVPAEIADPDLVARLLAPVLQIRRQEIVKRLSGSRTFAWLARKLPPQTAERIRAMNLRGIYFQREDERFYPKRQLASSVLGYVDIDEKGLGGIEYLLDEQIRSKPHRMLILADARRRWYESGDRQPDAGSSVVLTIDENIQYIAEKELAAAVRQTRSTAGTIVVQDPANGEILAMASWPTFNPNAAGDAPANSRMNRAVAALYEPGSIFKIVTIAAAINEGLTHPEELIDCQMGAIYIAGHRIRDHTPFGNLTVNEIMANSSDVGTIKLGLRLGASRFYDYIRAFGFGTLTGIDLPGESRGLLRRVENWTPVSVGSISMGQEIGVTPVQMISAVSAVANGGLLHRPHVVLAMRQGQGQATSPKRNPARVISPTTAATMRRMLEGVVLDGTGKLARLNGYTAAGKTGTAQKTDPATGRYSPTDHFASFVGFAPINEPVVSVLVQLDSPRGDYHGGSVAAPVFKRVVEQILAYRKVPHDVPVLQEARKGKAPERAQANVADFATGQIELADAAYSRLQQDLAKSVRPGTSPPTVEFAGGQAIVLPNLSGKTVREVTEIGVQAGFNPVLIGTGLVEEQAPEAGTMVPRGSSVIVRFGRTGVQSASSSSLRETRE